MGREDVILSDELNHASIIDGCRLSRATIKRFAHADAGSLREALRESGDYGHKLVVTDGVFSMDGDIAPLPDIVEVSEEFGAMVMVDDAHASGVLGRGGRGSVDHFDLHGRVHVQMGTLSKAIGAMGGYIAGTQALRDYLIQFGRPFLFSNGTPAGRRGGVPGGNSSAGAGTGAGGPAVGERALAEGAAGRSGASTWVGATPPSRR